MSLAAFLALTSNIILIIIMYMLRTKIYQAILLFN